MSSSSFGMKNLTRGSWKVAGFLAVLAGRLAGWHVAQDFDLTMAKEPTAQATRAAASASVNIDPLAKTFQGLVAVSVDDPPPRPKLRGKQVMREHLSKVEGRRIAEEDLLFDDMEPTLPRDVVSGPGSPRVVDLHLLGSGRTMPDLGDSSRMAQRVWSWGLRS